MLAASKLLSNKGENSFYHLNESQLLEKWMQDNGHVTIALFLAWKGSRFNWHVEAAPTYLTNLHWLLTFIHTLLVAVAERNKLCQGKKKRHFKVHISTRRKNVPECNVKMLL